MEDLKAMLGTTLSNPVVLAPAYEFLDHILGRREPVLWLKIESSHAAGYVESYGDVYALGFDDLTGLANLRAGDGQDQQNQSQKA